MADVLVDVLVLGGGGREHAFAAGIAASPRCGRLFVAPGNAGIAAIATCVPLDPCDAAAVTEFARAEGVGLVVVGPEAPLVAGVADAVAAAGIAVLGPGRAAAELENSKAFTKEICDAVGAPTAAWARFEAAGPARAYVAERGAPIVVKADGLAAGKGVTVAMTAADAIAAIDALFDGMPEGEAAVVIEEFMTGEEASLFVLCDATTALPLATAQDHKRAFDGDEGPNTGGMGAYSPAPVLSPAVEAAAMERIIAPVLAEMAARGTPFRGILYAGLMIEAATPRLVEFNVRFGDPEAQVVLPRLESDLLDLLLAAAEDRLETVVPSWRSVTALTVVLAAQGYPGRYAKGEAIGGLEAAAALPGVQVFHAGTAAGPEGAVLSAGGRVLAITALAPSLAEAQEQAYRGADAIDWPGGFYRRDIGWRALAQEDDDA
ncbi:MAG: phosphoribosylamine--glycine ligase [Pseudomonadota bacterium]